MANQAIGAEFQINAYTRGDQENPSVTALSHGGFVVIWESQDNYRDQRNESRAVYGQRYDADGTELGEEFRIARHGTADQERPSVTGLSDGGFVVAWQSLLYDLFSMTATAMASTPSSTMRRASALARKNSRSIQPREDLRMGPR